MLKRFAFALAVLAVPVIAQAGTVTETASIGQTLTDFTGSSLSPLAQFDGSLGTLLSVEIDYNVSANTYFTLSNTAGSSQTFIFKTDVDLTLNSTNPGIDSIVTTDLDPKFSTGSITLAGNASQSFGSVGSPLSNSKSASNTYSTGLAPFIGNGDLGLVVSTATGSTFVGGGGNIANAQTTTAGGAVTVIYTFQDAPPTSTPEPATFVAAAMGLVAFGFTRLRRKSA